MEKNIQDLRTRLFDVMDSLKEGKMDVKVAQTINESAQVLVNSAKVEVQFMRLTNGNGTGFVPVQKGKKNKKLAA